MHLAVLQADTVKDVNHFLCCITFVVRINYGTLDTQSTEICIYSMMCYDRNDVDLLASDEFLI